MVARTIALFSLLAIAVACDAQQVTSPLPDRGAGSPSAPPTSVICDAFAEGGPVELTTDAVIGNLEGRNVTGTTREAIAGYEDIAERAGGEEREDVLALAEAMNAAELGGEGVMGWNDASEAFYVKYAEQCGFEVAP